MAYLMLLVSNAVALGGAWFAGLGIGDVLVVLFFDMAVALYLLSPLVAAHRERTRKRGHFDLVTTDSGEIHASALTYGPTTKLGTSVLVLLGLLAGGAWAVDLWSPEPRLLPVLGVSLAASLVGFTVEYLEAGSRPFSWLRTQVRAVGVRLPAILIVLPLAWLLQDLGLICIIVMVGVKTAVEFGLLTVLDRILAGEGAVLGVGLSSSARRDIERLADDASSAAALEEERLDEALFARLRREAFGNMGIATGGGA